MAVGNRSLSSRIVGGKLAPVGLAPFACVLMIAADNSQYCGGSIISEKWVLTASHCIER